VITVTGIAMSGIVGRFIVIAGVIAGSTTVMLPRRIIMNAGGNNPVSLLRNVRR
jgi:uncharacterized membrane protein YraQ (UPF0718 family)